MRHPQEIVVLESKSSYELPTFTVTNEGMVDGPPMVLQFCKGNRADESVPRHTGPFTETLVAAAIKYLQENNVGELSSRETSLAVTKFEEGLMWLKKRADDRQARGVQGTYQK